MNDTVQKIVQYDILDNSGFENQNDPITLNLKVAVKNSSYIVHRGLVNQIAKKRQGTAHTKTRSNVRGGGRKPWKQKGTGKARAGSIRSPLWKGGGIIFGPKTCEYRPKINTKEKKLAIRTLLYNKRKSTIGIKEDLLNLEQPSTKEFKRLLNLLGINLENKVLIITAYKNNNLYLASRNLKNIEVIDANHINVYALLSAQKIISTEQSSQIIEKVYI